MFIKSYQIVSRADCKKGISCQYTNDNVYREKNPINQSDQKPNCRTIGQERKDATKAKERKDAKKAKENIPKNAKDKSMHQR